MATTERAVVGADIRALIANDAYAISFQTMGQYRTALLKAIDALAQKSQGEAVAPHAAPATKPYPIRYVLTDADHLAVCADRLLGAINEHAAAMEAHDDDDTPASAQMVDDALQVLGECMRSIRECAYEYRKRAERYRTSLVTASPADQVEDARDVVDGLKPGCCHKCGLPLSQNPHPEAGKPAHYLEVGCQKECIPCTVKGRHNWASQAMKNHRDAERYRWVRNTPVSVGRNMILVERTGEMLDCMIDAAMSASKVGNENG
ncbi:hypothetical protein N234_31805 [Ralstonia pickettii DTP0602]|nr:hypothetical protein N234_31805 [Ralstonia pickettii DTP0602]